MANKTSAAGNNAAKTERKIPIEKLRRSCVKLFGITPSTFDGATAGMEGNFTVAEMQAHITAWLGQPVTLGKKEAN